ncbi:hypothetical protein NQ317_015979 [Molorchus minor]|uniref:Uncharacterized protein n=1 Tax=Molorchus minor TaxID=1323400 RepID=A0ABQ9JVH1_9CUCU|nr:hypothetical protein NQ317_015979 [Molorchus minor]
MLRIQFGAGSNVMDEDPSENWIFPSYAPAPLELETLFEFLDKQREAGYFSFNPDYMLYSAIGAQAYSVKQIMDLLFKKN